MKALALAGVMGGYDSMITAETKNILVEAAWFDPASIRASSRRHLIHTDASHRFERGADFAAAPTANALVTKHILAACGGTIEGELVDVIVPEHQAATAGRAAIKVSVAQVRRHLGTTVDPEGITSALVRRFLSALGCSLTVTGDETYEVKLPSWRLDLTREIDLIEEIARVYGYNRFANTLPTPGVVVDHATARAERTVRQTLLALGFTEALSSTFASAADSAFFSPEKAAVALENPLSEEAANLRPSLLPGMVEMLGHNLNRDVLSVRIFEAGGVFSGSAAEVFEGLSLSLGITGASAASNLYEVNDGPFYELKGAVERLVGMFDAPAPVFQAGASAAAFEVGRFAVVLLGDDVLARFGQLAAAEAARRKLRQAVWVAEIDLAGLLGYPQRQRTAKEISRFQAVERDFSFTLADAVTWGQITGAIQGLSIEELRSVAPVELWRDAKKYPGVYSTLVRTVFQSLERTLVDEELAEWSRRIIAALEGLGGKLRG